MRRHLYVFVCQASSPLTDPLVSALDRATEARVYNALFGAYGLRCNQTTILATNALHLIHSAPHLILLKQGKLQAQGTYAHLAAALPASLSTSTAQSDRQSTPIDKEQQEWIAESQEASEDEIVDRSNSSTLKAIQTNFKSAGYGPASTMVAFIVVAFTWKGIGYLFLAKAWVNRSLNQQRAEFATWVRSFCLSRHTTANRDIRFLYGSRPRPATSR